MSGEKDLKRGSVVVPWGLGDGGEKVPATS